MFGLEMPKNLIQNGTCTLSEVIGCRDDIMVNLIYQGLEPSLAFKIMEFVRKGRGLKPMNGKRKCAKMNVPEWYIDSCKKIKYMFPKAHAAAYVLMAVRIAYFKVHYPLYYYAAYFTVRAEDFELEAMSRVQRHSSKIEEINAKGMDATAKEKNLLTVLELALEMCERGFKFQPVDLYRSQATEFVIDGDSLIPPFNAIPGLGTSAAQNIVQHVKKESFYQKKIYNREAKYPKLL